MHQTDVTHHSVHWTMPSYEIRNILLLTTFVRFPTRAHVAHYLRIFFFVVLVFCVFSVVKLRLLVAWFSFLLSHVTGVVFIIITIRHSHRRRSANIISNWWKYQIQTPISNCDSRTYRHHRNACELWAETPRRCAIFFFVFFVFNVDIVEAVAVVLPLRSLLALSMSFYARVRSALCKFIEMFSSIFLCGHKPWNEQATWEYESLFYTLPIPMRNKPLCNGIRVRFASVQMR